MINPLRVILSLFRKLTFTVDEDEGYTDHMVGQKAGPFYCGTAFCGHHTKKAARECWARHCARCQAFQEKESALRAQGRREEVRAMYTVVGNVAYPKVGGGSFPEHDPKNWPCNRASSELQREYLERARREIDGDSL